MSKTVFVKNAAVLTVSSIVLRLAGIGFKVWLAARIGSEGMGLYQLIFSLFVLAGAFTQSGLPTAVTRLVAGESALGGKKGIEKRMNGASYYDFYTESWANKCAEKVLKCDTIVYADKEAELIRQKLSGDKDE